MADTKLGLVLHLVGSAQPLRVALSREEAEKWEKRLPELMRAGEVASLATANGGLFTVNFGQVATAHVEATRSDTVAYGAPSRGAGFRS